MKKQSELLKTPFAKDLIAFRKNADTRKVEEDTASAQRNFKRYILNVEESIAEANRDLRALRLGEYCDSDGRKEAYSVHAVVSKVAEIAALENGMKVCKAEMELQFGKSE